ncbi:MAG: hypothetical protein FWH07_05940 [Oscillospiraceae bacterium]|nr:hypothetical protein [Oscillospiraceae bacterium]
MKLQNKFYVIVVIIAMLLATLAGCAESENNGTVAPQADEAQADIADEVQLDMSDNETDSACFAPLMIENVDDFRSELLRHFELSRTVGKEDEDYWVYSDNKIADIKKFYFPTMEIGGYELYRVDVSEYQIYYCYVSTELLKNSEEFWLSLNPSIQILIQRPSAIRDVGFEHPFDIWTKSAREQGETLTEDNMLYSDFEGYGLGGYGRITAPIGDTVFTISVPSYPTNDAFVRVDEYEVSRELALRFIETAELITVG